MELKGSIKERPSLELLESLAEEGSSGILTLSKGREDIQVHIKHGTIVQVTLDPVPKQGNFGQMMVEIGQINPSQLEQALGQQRQGLVPLGQILVKLFHCDRNKVMQVLRVQSLERLYGTFFWKSGHYTFESKPIASRDDLYDPIPIMKLVEEAYTVKERWPKARKRFHSPELEIEAIGPSLPPDISLGPLEHKVFELIATGLFRFRELSILSGLGQFATGAALSVLKEHQLIIVRNPQKQGVNWGRLFLGGTLSEFAVWVLVMGMLVGATTYLLAFAPYSPLRWFRSSQQHFVSAPGWDESVDAWREQRIRAVLELYRLQYGQYPSGLSKLNDNGWIQNSQLRAQSGRMFSYRLLSPFRYRLLRPGP
ncbi:MAG: DUF4388 domain-containing protein [Deltaproteobacteria bacterium]|nr:MAG: DUF4388 domain-containing protein [Deltaproteobacteria bacterium]